MASRRTSTRFCQSPHPPGLLRGRNNPLHLHRTRLHLNQHLLLDQQQHLPLAVQVHLLYTYCTYGTGCEQYIFGESCLGEIYIISGEPGVLSSKHDKPDKSCLCYNFENKSNLVHIRNEYYNILSLIHDFFQIG